MDEQRPSKLKVFSPESDPISFPHLRYLRLNPDCLDAPTFTTLISAPIRHLQLPCFNLAALTSFLATTEPLLDLESLVIALLPVESEACMHIVDFINRHRHIQKLYVHEQHRVHRNLAQLGCYIIPALTSPGFNNLRCLSLAWGRGCINNATRRSRPHETHVPESALAAIGTIASLEKLSLCAGVAGGWRHQWLIDHNKLRAHLAGLKRLRMLALVRDTYHVLDTVGIEAERYYSLRLVGVKDHEDATARMDLDTDDAFAAINPEYDNEEGEESDPDAQTWERAHRNRMLAHAETYAAVLPALEWVLCGQRPMAFQQHPRSSTAPKIAVPLTEYRDGCLTFLKRTFGIGGY